MFLYFIFVLINIVFLAFADNKSNSLLYKDFDPKDKNEYEQVLDLMTQEQLFLLNPDEDPENVLQLYIKGLNGSQDKGYKGLKLKLLIRSEVNPKNNKVLGFICYVPQKENQKFPFLIRTVAIDQEYRRKGLARYLLAKIGQEAINLHKKDICLAVYSNNDSMLSLLKKEKFKLYQKDENPAFSLYNPETQKETFIHTFVMCKELKARRF